MLETAVTLVNQRTVGQCSGFFLNMLQIMLLLHHQPTQQSHLTVNHLSFFGLSCCKHIPFTKWKSDVCFRRSACLGEIPDLPKITNFKTAYCCGGNHLVRNNSPHDQMSDLNSYGMSARSWGHMLFGVPTACHWHQNHTFHIEQNIHSTKQTSNNHFHAKALCQKEQQ